MTTKPTITERHLKCVEELHPEYKTEWWNNIHSSQRPRYELLYKQAEEKRDEIAQILSQHFPESEGVNERLLSAVKEIYNPATGCTDRNRYNKDLIDGYSFNFHSRIDNNLKAAIAAIEQQLTSEKESEYKEVMNNAGQLEGTGINNRIDHSRGATAEKDAQPFVIIGTRPMDSVERAVLDELMNQDQPSTAQSETPRSDAFFNERHTMNAYRKVLTFARTLELELTSMTDNRDVLTGQLLESRNQLSAMTARAELAEFANKQANAAIGDIANECKQLRSQLDSMSKDKERLDWIQANEASINQTLPDQDSIAQQWHVYYHPEFQSMTEHHFDSESVRQAIDSAITAQKEKL